MRRISLLFTALLLVLPAIAHADTGTGQTDPYARLEQAIARLELQNNQLIIMVRSLQTQITALSASR